MEEQGHIAIVHQFGRTYRALLSTFEAQVGHAMPRWRILRALAEPDTEWSQKRLVEHLRIDPGALTRQLKALEALRWIERSTDHRDNRVTNVRLTKAGAGVVAASLPRRQAFLRETMGALPEAALAALSDALAMLEGRIALVAGNGEIAVADKAPHPREPVAEGNGAR
ncbi:MAG TPA: MarR family transcriptional regulator [Trinickia sp.]|jgi:DNA-binding MarR family transcriptional regulator|nr:MarR family transcriptional regulator [Trinickia sp.]